MVNAPAAIPLGAIRWQPRLSNRIGTRWETALRTTGPTGSPCDRRAHGRHHGQDSPTAGGALRTVNTCADCYGPHRPSGPPPRRTPRGVHPRERLHPVHPFLGHGVRHPHPLPRCRSPRTRGLLPSPTRWGLLRLLLLVLQLGPVVLRQLPGPQPPVHGCPPPPFPTPSRTLGSLEHN